ncbi:MAG TPA: hypothetical protein VGD16_03815 [Enterovirga sp.]
MSSPTRSALIGLVLASSVAGAFVPSALAKDFYTRKRIDGRWVYGEFPKKGSQAEKDQAAQPAPAGTAAAPAAPAPAAASTPFTLGLHFAPPTQPVVPADPAVESQAATTGSIRERRSRRHAAQQQRRAEPLRVAERDRVRVEDSKPELRRTADNAVPAVAPPPSAAAPASPAPAAMAAVEPRFASLPASTEKPAESVADPKKRLADALAAKAAALASGSIASASDPIPAPKAEPASVNYDYKKGIKTVIYANGKVDEEPFDPATMKALAATTPR